MWCLKDSNIIFNNDDEKLKDFTHTHTHTHKYMCMYIVCVYRYI